VKGADVTKESLANILIAITVSSFVETESFAAIILGAI
jgi:hypothetical protein